MTRCPLPVQLARHKGLDSVREQHWLTVGLRERERPAIPPGYPLLCTTGWLPIQRALPCARHRVPQRLEIEAQVASGNRRIEEHGERIDYIFEVGPLQTRLLDEASPLNRPRFRGGCLV